MAKFNVYVDYKDSKRPLQYVPLKAKNVIEAGKEAEEYIDTLAQEERQGIYCIGLEETARKNTSIVGRFRPYEWHECITFGFHFEG